MVFLVPKKKKKTKFGRPLESLFRRVSLFIQKYGVSQRILERSTNFLIIFNTLIANYLSTFSLQA